MNFVRKQVLTTCLILFSLLPWLLFPQKAIAKEVSIVAVGDINLGGRVNSIIKQYGYYYPVSKFKKILTSADITFGNLECALSNRGKPVANKEFTFCGSPLNVQTLQLGGFDVVSVANNHSKDFGEEAFLDTLKILKENGIKPVGGGKNLDEALRPHITEKSGLKIAFLAFSGVLPYGWSANRTNPGVASLKNLIEVKRDVREATKQANLVVVSLHWGIELSPQPLNQQEQIAHQLIDAGANLIIGHHPHVIQKIEVYKTGLIAYSMGNFIFTPGSPKGSKSILLKVKLDKYGLKSFQVWPVKIINAQPEIAREETAKDIINFLSREPSLKLNQFQTNDSTLLYRTYRAQKINLFKKLIRAYFPG